LLSFAEGSSRRNCRHFSGVVILQENGRRKMRPMRSPVQAVRRPDMPNATVAMATMAQAAM
jgi:hypothetical protein